MCVILFVIHDCKFKEVKVSILFISYFFKIFLISLSNFICCKIYLLSNDWLIIANQNSDEFILMFDMIKIIISSYHFCALFLESGIHEKDIPIKMSIMTSQRIFLRFSPEKEYNKTIWQGEIDEWLEDICFLGSFVMRLVNECRVENWSV